MQLSLGDASGKIMHGMGTRVGSGRYTLTSRKGAGGAGEVWSARDERLARDVAIKRLRGTDSRSLARFRHEALATASLVLPTRGHVSDYFIEDGQAYIVMDLLGGVSLSELVNALGPLDPRRAAKLVMDVCSALEYAHERGIIHRDVKPANIQVVPDPDGGEHASVLDFGIAKLVDATALTETGATLGTPAFMAPEQITGHTADPRIDVYAAGMTLYFALTGQLPFAAATPQAVIAAVIAGNLRSLRSLQPDLDPELIAIVERATARSPEQRVASARDLRTALASWFCGTARSDRPAPITSPTVAHALPTIADPAISRPRQRAIWLGALVGAALLLSVAAVGLAGLGRSADDVEPPPPSAVAPTASVTELVPLPVPTSSLPQPTPSDTPAPRRAGPTAAPSCQRPSWACAGRCVDLERDARHCGGCGRSCATDQTCLNGACIKCPIGVGFSLCNGRCIETLSDPANCGSCGRRCPWGRCQAGRCT